jgi:CubicO group peptidase (beta-lactamase class C family)
LTSAGGLKTPAAPIADVFYNNTNITRIRSNGAYWADGGIVSTTEDMIALLKALNNGQLISEATLQSMHNWRRLQNLPFEYGYGTMYFTLRQAVNTVVNMPPVWGHTGSDGSFLYYSEDLDLYMAGTIDQNRRQRGANRAHAASHEGSPGAQVITDLLAAERGVVEASGPGLPPLDR